MPTAIVTGAGSGIGRATALRLARQDFSLALVGRTVGPLEETADQIYKVGAHARAKIFPADTSNDDQVQLMVDKVVDAFGRIDALVHCAGSAPSIPLSKLSPKAWRDILESNLSSAFYTAHAVWPVMQRQFEQARAASAEKPAGGVIINISSMAAKDPFPGLGAYGAAKAGINLLTMALAREGKDLGIRAVAIAPAAVDTPMFHQLVAGRPIPDGVMLAPDDVAAMILQAINGCLQFSSGDTLYIHRKPA